MTTKRVVVIRKEYVSPFQEILNLQEEVNKLRSISESLKQSLDVLRDEYADARSLICDLTDERIHNQRVIHEIEDVLRDKTIRDDDVIGYILDILDVLPMSSVAKTKR